MRMFGYYYPSRRKQIMYKIINLAIAISALLLISCAHTNKNAVDGFLSEFQSSGSPCIDGLVVNMAAAGCQEIATKTFPTSGPVEIRCANPSLSNPEYPYLSNTFIVAPMIDMLPAVSKPICNDAVTALGVINTWSPRLSEPAPSSPSVVPEETPTNTQNPPVEEE